MSEPSLDDVLIAIARIEAKQDAMMDKLDRLENDTSIHWKKISEIETQIELLKQAHPARVHWITYVIGAAAGVSLALAILDRIYLH